LSRMLLLTQRVFQGLSGLLFIALICGVSDYLLRLPGMVRLVSDVLVIGLASVWFLTRMVHAARFSPTLTLLAMRAEVMYPQLKDQFASAIDFLNHQPGSAHSETMRKFETLSLDRVESQMQDVNLMRLLNPTHVARYGCVFLSLMVIMAAIAWASPQGFSLAASRWLKPLGSAQWPRRVEIKSLNSQNVWPVDSPLPMQLVVERGDHKTMRAWLNYRYLTAGHTHHWQSVLMTQQAQAQGQNPRFERLIDLGSSLLPADLPAQIEFYYQADDGQTVRQQINIVARPSVQRVELQIKPPEYAVGLIRDQTVTWDMTQVHAGLLRSTRVLTGSTVKMKITLNKPVISNQVQKILAGLMNPSDSMLTVDDVFPNVLHIQWPLMQTMQSLLWVEDEYGLTNLSEKQYRIEAIADLLPSVSLTQPVQDISVLPTAKLPVIATSRDDVSLERLTVTLKRQQAESKSQILAQQVGRQSELNLQTLLDIKKQGGVPGDVFELAAIAQDSYHLVGETHLPVQSSLRLVHVIDEEKFTQQIRSELGVIRQMALRLFAEQQLLEKAPSATAKPRQKRVTEQLAQHRQTLDRINDRMMQNGLKSEPLQQIVDRAKLLLDQAKQASKQATAQLDEPQRQASAQLQNRVSQNLTALVELLDQGRDALTLQLLLQQMEADQQKLLEKSRKLLPKTLGKTKDQLDDETQKQVSELAQQQQSLSEQAGGLLNRMRQTAERLAQQTQAQDKASAESLAQAASTAQKQGLKQTMAQAAQSASQNQLAQTTSQQQQSLDIIQQMRKQMGQQSKRKQAILKRQMTELAQLLKQLAKRQQQQIDQLGQTNDLLSLVEPQVLLRQNTISVQDQAMSNPQTQQVGQDIEQAITEQAHAVRQLRDQHQANSRTHQVQALAHLNNALAAVEAAKKKIENDQQKQKRDDLQKAYEQLADRENKLAARVKPYAEFDTLSRRHRRDLRELSGDQDALRSNISDLNEQVEKTTLFIHLHEQMDKSLLEINRRLRQGIELKQANDQQYAIENRLRQMAKVLQMQSKQERFSDAQEGESGGGSGGSKPSAGVVPPIAELLLLREIQMGLHELTQEAQQANASEDQILNLFNQQRDLSDMGQKLIDKFMQNQQAEQLQVVPLESDPEGGEK